MKNFNIISGICTKYNQKFEKLKIVPFFDRKMMCINSEAMETASSQDFDSFCTKVTASWVNDNSKCSYYTVSILAINIFL